MLANVSGSLPNTSLTMLMSPLFSASLSLPLNDVSSELAERSLLAVLSNVAWASASMLSASLDVLRRSLSVVFNLAALVSRTLAASATVADKDSICGCTLLA